MNQPLLPNLYLFAMLVHKLLTPHALGPCHSVPLKPTVNISVQTLERQETNRPSASAWRSVADAGRWTLDARRSTLDALLRPTGPDNNPITNLSKSFDNDGNATAIGNVWVGIAVHTFSRLDALAKGRLLLWLQLFAF
jgi:hypothetical protein